MDVKSLLLLDPRFQLLMQVNDAMGAALTPEQLIFVRENFTKAVPYLYSDAGKAAFRDFVMAWQTAPNK